MKAKIFLLTLLIGLPICSVKSIARFILFVELRLCHSLFLLYEVVGCEINH